MDQFKHPRSPVSEDGILDEEATRGVQPGRLEGLERDCDRRVNVKIKGRACKSVIRPVIMGGGDTWPVEENQRGDEVQDK